MYGQEGGRAVLHALYAHYGLLSCAESSACSPGACACIATADSAYEMHHAVGSVVLQAPSHQRAQVIMQM